MHGLANLYWRLPHFKSHKVVGAMKITEVVELHTKVGESRAFDVVGDNHRIRLGEDWHEKFQPKAGGYIVVYEDGYVSFSPANAFEDGYTPVEDMPTSVDTTFVERLNAEHAVLNDRYEKLSRFLNSDAAGELSAPAAQLLSRQWEVMGEYLGILVERRRLFETGTSSSDTPA